jgi:hypothetical protein
VTPKRSERQTIPPSLDLPQHARDSDARLAGARATGHARPWGAEDGGDTSTTPRSDARLITRPNLGAVLTDEAWARGVVGAPYVVVPSDQLKRLPLGHRAGFLLSQMDGVTDLETIIELAAMPREETLRLARDLFESGVIAFR